jgi:hypothetical protein
MSYSKVIVILENDILKFIYAFQNLYEKEREKYSFLSLIKTFIEFVLSKNKNISNFDFTFHELWLFFKNNNKTDLKKVDHRTLYKPFNNSFNKLIEKEIFVFAGKRGKKDLYRINSEHEFWKCLLRK